MHIGAELEMKGLPNQSYELDIMQNYINSMNMTSVLRVLIVINPIADKYLKSGNDLQKR